MTLTRCHITCHPEPLGNTGISGEPSLGPSRCLVRWLECWIFPDQKLIGKDDNPVVVVGKDDTPVVVVVGNDDTPVVVVVVGKDDTPVVVGKDDTPVVVVVG